MRVHASSFPYARLPVQTHWRLRIGFQPRDARGYFMLPQAPQDAGYYVYGTPERGAGQYVHASLMSVLLHVEREWQSTDRRKFGIGNISKAEGVQFKPHGTHKNGLQVDVRPLRKDGSQVGVSFTNPGYDYEGTKRLIDLFRSHAFVKKVFFNDSRIVGVHPLAGHHDHFHVEVWAKL